MTVPDERRSARIAAISALLVVSSFVAGKAGRDAILLSSFSIKSLPLFIGLSAASALPVILLTGRLMIRFGPARLIPVMNVVSAAFAIGEYLMIESAPRTVAVVVFFHLSTSSAVLVSGFWSTVNERFDIQSAKRHIGRIGLGATLGGILGGVIAERTAVILGRDAILLVLAGLQLTSASMLTMFARGAPPRAEAPAGQPPVTMRASLGVVVRSRLLRTVGIVVVMSAVVAGVMDYVFKADLTAAATTHSSLLRSLAMFYTVTNVITAVVQITICGPLINKLGVPRSVSTLPAAVTGFGILAAALPLPLTSVLARGSELVTRNSIYRAGYELLYAPLPEEHKRPTKVVLDVGADKLGDIIGAQLVGALVFYVADSRTALLVATIVVGVIGLAFALRLPGAYTQSLEHSLLSHGKTAEEPDPGFSLSGLPSMADAGDVVPLRLHRRHRRKQHAVQTPAPSGDAVVHLVRELRAPEVERVRRALEGAPPQELVPQMILLVGRDEVAREACTALAGLAPNCTGAIVDALLDQARPAALRRRLPAVLVHGEPALAAWGLWRGLVDDSFDVRYRSGVALAKLAADGHITDLQPETVYATVLHELGGGEGLKRQLEQDAILTGEDEGGTQHALQHIFRMLGLVLPAEPLRIALHALQVDDPALRATALEYLESILPPAVRAQLWPLLAEEEPAEDHPSRSQDELLANLREGYPSVLEKLKRRAS